MPDDPPQYEIVLPFVACRSHGGPYDDASFVAGFTAASIDAKLSVARSLRAEVVFHESVRADLVPQLDLIAMRHGFRLEAEVDETQITAAGGLIAAVRLSKAAT